jgi:methylated-DNA-[protein]-cysteine S-methyltransferase
MKLFLSHLSSPLGELLVVTDEAQNIRALDFADHKSHLQRALREFYGPSELTVVPAPTGIAAAIAGYFAAELDALDALPTSTTGSELQRGVWDALRNIPVGTTLTYGRLAKQLGFQDPRAAIDIGAAAAANPIAIVVPCHRLVGSNGDLKGYAWGLHRKRWLLEHERAIAPKSEAGKTATLPGF